MVFRPIKSLLFYLSHEKKQRESEKCNDSNDNNESVIDYKELYENEKREKEVSQCFGAYFSLSTNIFGL